MKKLIVSLLRYLAFEKNRAVGLWRWLGDPDGEQWADYISRHGGLHAIGKCCSIQANVTITDPSYVRLGNNVRLSGCTLFGHDGTVNMLCRAYGVLLDHVGPVDIRDNVFVGHGAIVLPGVTIGPNVIVAAGSVVTRDVPPDSIVAGVPARRVADLGSYVERLAAQTRTLPWFDLIEKRGVECDFDPVLQPALDRRRVAVFFPSSVGAAGVDAAGLEFAA